MKSPGSDVHKSGSDSHRTMRTALEKTLVEIPELRSVPPIIPDHVLLQRIGYGAYGEVWLAQNALGTLRAVKIVFRDRFEDERPFQREFHGILKYEPVSRTQEGLIAILHVGRNDPEGYFYYIMELADEVRSTAGEVADGSSRESSLPAGAARAFRPRSLRTDLVKNRLSPVVAAQLALRIAAALAHLHKHGLVHRDVKPSNVIFVNGQPKLADIGLITTVGDSRSFVGTEGFIPPEGPGTPEADLYALGKLLYEMATGSDRLEFPQLPPGAARTPEGEAILEINEIITRACAPDKQDRYGSATQLIADLNLFLAGRSLREARRLEHHVIWSKRLAVVGCFVLAVAGLALAVAKTQVHRAKEREQASRERARIESSLRLRAEAAERESKQQLYTALLEQARATVRSGELGQRIRALEAIRRAAVISNSFELRSVALAALALPDLQLKREIRSASEYTAYQLDPKFERTAACRGTNEVEILSASDGRLLAELPASSPSPVYVIRWSPDGRYLAVKRDVEALGSGADLEVWDVGQEKRKLLLHDVDTGAFSFNAQRPELLAGHLPEGATTWDLESGKIRQEYELPNAPAFLAFSPKGDQFAAAYQSGQGGWTVSVYRTANGEVRASFPDRDRPSWLDWDPGQDLLLASDHGGRVRLLDPRTGTARTLGRHKAEAVLAAFCGKSGYALSGGWERELICWDVRAGRQAFTIGLNSFVAQVRDDGLECAIGTGAGLRIYAVQLPGFHKELGDELGGRLWSATFSPNGRWLAVPGQDKLGVWDLANAGPPAMAPEAAGARVFFSPDGGQLYACSDKACYGYKLQPGLGPNGPPTLQSLQWTVPPDFSSLCVVSNQIVLTSTSGSRVVEPEALSNSVGPSAPTSDGISGASPDGRWLAVYRPYSLLLHIYELPTLKPAFVLTNSGRIHAFEFSPDGSQLAVASNRRVEFWDTATWQLTRSVGNFMGVLFANGEGPWWMTKDYHTGGLYDRGSFDPVLPLPPGMLPLALTKDGKRLAVSVDSRRVQVWDLEELHAQFRQLGIDWGSGG